MKRSGPIKRRTWMRRKRATPRKSGRVRDRAYLLAVRGLPCCLGLMKNCAGPIQAHHAGRHPMGRKASDDTAIPLCEAHHRALHDVIGTRTARQWADEAIAETRAWLGKAIEQTRARLLRKATKEAPSV